MEKDAVVIVAAKRTPMGSMLGTLSSLKAPHLAAFAHQAALLQAGIEPDHINEVISGCVLQAGIGQAPARQAAIKAGLPYSTGALTINKMCGSGMKAVMLAHDLVTLNPAHIILAGGMESMSNAPYLLTKARQGLRLGHGELKDHLFLDGLEDAYDPGKVMGIFAEKAATEYSISREQQDNYARMSMNRALYAQEKQLFKEEIVAVDTVVGKEPRSITQDESPHPDKLAKIDRLNPVFSAQGTITAANSSSISDGAASLILMSESKARALGITPLARIIAHTSYAQAPEWFTTAPIEAIRQILDKARWTVNQVDLFEINEAFAVVALLAIQALDIDIDKVNIHGGACALGHPIGASGARILVTLLHALKQRQGKRGVASLCIGGGEAVAMAIELL